MRRSVVVLLTILGIVSVLAAGFLGFQGAQAQKDDEAQKPDTIPVSRGDVQQTVDAPGRLVSTREVLLGMATNGPVAKINVQPGHAVSRGQVLASLDNEAELQANLAQAKAESASAKTALRQVHENAPLITAEAQKELAEALEELRQAEFRNTVQQEGNRAGTEMIAAAEAKLVLAEEEVKRAESAYNRYSGRSENNPARASARLHLAQARMSRDSVARALNWYNGQPTELQQAILNADIAIAEARVVVAKLAYDQVKEGPDPDVLAQAEARLAQAESLVAQAEVELAGMQIVAPFDGVILEVNARVGDIVTAHAGFILLCDMSSLEVEVTMIEEDIPLIQTGQTVELYFDAAPDAVVQGEVTRIVPRRIPGSDRPLYPVYIHSDEMPETLVPGMTADASIVIDKRADVLRLPRALVRARSDGSAEIDVWLNGRIEERTIQTGLRGDVYVEILEGLREGDEVVGQ
jgi:multidrug efflux pump subunit AcrA (membrane-fusion protein)